MRAQYVSQRSAVFKNKAHWVGDGVRRAGAAFVQESVRDGAFFALRAFVFRVRSRLNKLELQNRSRTVSWTSETSSRGVWSMAKIRSVQSPEYGVLVIAKSKLRRQTWDEGQ